MKKRYIIAALAVGALSYLLSRKKTASPSINVAKEPKHHLTKVFSKAKQRSASPQV